MAEPLTEKELAEFRRRAAPLHNMSLDMERRILATIVCLEGEKAAKDAAPREAARLYHEAKHFILGEVDRKRFPSYLECPYWPCVDFRAALEALEVT